MSKANIKKPITIALVSDPHISADIPDYTARFQRAIAGVNDAAPDIVIVSGDLVDQASAGAFEDYKRLAAAFKRTPFFVPGNHDVGGKHVDGELDPVTSESVEMFERRSVALLGGGSLRIRLIGITASVLGSGLEIEERQWRFLESALDSAGDKPTILVSHYPLFVDEANEPGDRYWNVEPEPRQRLFDLITRSEVSAVLSGHVHKPLRASYGNTSLITTLPVSFGLPIGVQSEGWTLVAIDCGVVTAKEIAFD